MKNTQTNGLNLYTLKLPRKFQDLLKVVYIDKNHSYLKDLDLSSTTGSPNDKQSQESSSYDGRNGVRSIRISPDGKHLASGDRSGNIRVHDTATMQELLIVEAHDAEVLCLEYTGADSEHKLMASASRDRLIHVFDVNNVGDGGRRGGSGGLKWRLV